MAFVTHEEIVSKAQAAYARFLIKWICGEDGDFFPYRVRARFSVNSKNPKDTIRASENLLAKSKAERGWGYTVHREQVRMRDFGANPVPTAFTIDTLNDLLRLSKRKDEFDATCFVVTKVRESLSQLNNWLITNVRSLHRLCEPIDGLIEVTRFFMEHPWPDCYARQIPVAVDTKFIERHAPTLRQWLDQLLPSSAIDVNETKFTRRFGLRDKQSHRAIRVLDPSFQLELGLPFDELSLPIEAISKLHVSEATIVIAENDVNVLTLPAINRGIGLQGQGSSVSRLRRVNWLNDNRLIYWGDIDVEGFLILSRLRNLFWAPESQHLIFRNGTIAGAVTDFRLCFNWPKPTPKPRSLARNRLL